MHDKSGKRIFSRISYEENDGKAKNAIRRYFDSIGIYSIVPKESYNVDILAYNNVTGEERRHEVEMKNQWVDGWPFNWKEVRIPVRKGKLLDSADDISFWIIAGDCKHAWVVTGKQMTQDRIRKVPIRPCPQGEEFYCIPVSECSLVTL